MPPKDDSRCPTGRKDIDEEKQPEIPQISCGSTHVIVRTKGGDVYTWGFGDQGACGQGEDDKRCFVPEEVGDKAEECSGISG
eukprot:scaffold1593_cov193-Alexandrium_tamarense.AAC.115